jgi:hypothetical protein
VSAWEPQAFFSALLNGNQFDTADKKLDCVEEYWPKDVQVLIDALPSLNRPRTYRLLDVMQAYAVDLKADRRATLDELKGGRAESSQEAKQHLTFLSDRIAEVQLVISCLLVQRAQPKDRNPADGVLRSAKQALANWEVRHGETAASRELRQLIEQAERGEWPVHPAEVQGTVLPRLKVAHAAEVRERRPQRDDRSRECYTARRALFSLAKAVLDNGDPSLMGALDGLEIFHHGVMMPLRAAVMEMTP